MSAQEAVDGDDSTVRDLRGRLSMYAVAHPSSNLYLHLDKTIYSPNETVWFKAYLLGDTSMKARVLYVRIVNRERTVVAQGQFPVYDIRSHGSLDLSSPDRSRVIGYRYIYDPPWEPFEGDYTLYAYTDHMVAVNDTNVFVQPISIRRMGGRALEAEAAVANTTRLERGGDVRVKATVRYGGSPLEGAHGEYRLLSGGKELGYGRLRTDVLGNSLVDFTYPFTVPDSGSLRLEFLFRHGDAIAELSLVLPHRDSPLLVDCRGEGGVLVAGGRASVEVLDIHDHPVSTGVLVMDGDAIVDSLHTDGQGIAIWDIPPVPDRRYTLIAGAGRCRLPVDVPAAAGYTLRLTAGPTGQRAMVCNHGVIGNALLVIRSPDEVVWSRARGIAKGDSAAVDIPTGVLPAGVWSLAVFDEDGRLHAERLFGDTGSGSHRLSVDVDRREYGRKQQVTVRMRATDEAGNPVVANLSVSAIEKARVDSTMFPDIADGFYYKDFQQGVRRRLSGIGSDGLLMGLSWPGNGWEDVLSRTAVLPHVPGTDGTRGLVVGMRYEPNAEYSADFVPVKRNIREVRLRATRGRLIDSGFDPAVEWMTIGVDPETGTFFIPDSLLLSPKGQEWLLEIPRGNPPWRYEYLVDWQNPDIAFDSTIVRSDQLYRLAVLGNFATSAPPRPAATDFGGMNLLQEAVVGGGWAAHT